ncbi:alpha/beta fold hydrolase [Devosia pacifica]|nr:alpha/beta hydrolase [Devosia pacifica]
MHAKATYFDTRVGRIAVHDTLVDRPPLLMLHGLGSDGLVFQRQFASPLADHFRLIAFDLPGHGQSDDCEDVDQAYTLPALAELTAAVLEASGIKRVAVFGWSIGGHIAIELMSRHPEMLSGVMISGAAPIGRGPVAALKGFQAHWDMLLASKAVYTSKDAERFARLCFKDGATPDDVAAVLRADGAMRTRVNRSLMRGEGANQKTVVQTSPIPLAVVNGSDEPVVRLRYLAGLQYRNLWEGMCHILPDAGHAPFRNRPYAFNTLLHRFAAEVAIHERATPPVELHRRA